MKFHICVVLYHHHQLIVFFPLLTCQPAPNPGPFDDVASILSVRPTKHHMNIRSVILRFRTVYFSSKLLFLFLWEYIRWSAAMPH